MLIYSRMQRAVAMEALQRITELTAQNTQQIQALVQALTSQQNQATAATQQVQELAHHLSRQQAAMTEATQATNQALSHPAELTANAVAATGKLTTEAANAIAQHAESRRPGEVDLQKLIKSPEAFGPTTYQEERDGFLEFRVKMRSWIGALNNANCVIKQRGMQMGTVRNAQQEDDQSLAQSTAAASSTSASSTTARTTSTRNAPSSMKSVRQIAMFHRGDEPTNFPEVCDLDENEEKSKSTTPVAS